MIRELGTNSVTTWKAQLDTIKHLEQPKVEDVIELIRQYLLRDSAELFYHTQWPNSVLES